MNESRKEIAQLEKQKFKLVKKVPTKQFRLALMIMSLIIMPTSLVLFILGDKITGENGFLKYFFLVFFGIALIEFIYSLTLKPSKKKADALMELFEPIERELAKKRYMYDSELSSLNSGDLEKIEKIYKDNCDNFYKYAETGDESYIKDVLKK